MSRIPFSPFSAAALLAAASLASCAQETAPVSSPSPEAVATAPPVEPEAVDPLRRLLGQWEVEQVGGTTPDWTRMLLVVGEDFMHWQSQCVSGRADFLLSGDGLRFGPIPRNFPGLEDRERPAYALCARGLSEAEQAASHVLAGDTTWYVDEGGRLVIDHPDGPLIASRLAEPVANPMEYIDWDPATTFGEWRVASLDGEAVADTVLIRAGGYTTLRSGCAYYQWLHWSDMTGTFELLRRAPFRTGCDRAERAQEASLARALEGVDKYTADGANGRILSGPEGRIVLARPEMPR